MLAAIAASLARKRKLWTVFEISFVFEMLALLAQAAIFIVIGSGIPSESALVSGFGGNYVEPVVLGIIALSFIEVSIIAPYSSLNEAYWNRRLEPLLMVPVPYIVHIIADTLWSYATALLKTLVYLAIGFALGIRLDLPAEILLPAVVLCLGLISLFGIGLISASMFSIINAKGWHDPVKWFFLTFQGLFSGIYFPIAILPGALQAVARIMPQTYMVDTIRRMFIASYNNTPHILKVGDYSPVMSNMLVLALLAFVYLSLGSYLFKLAMEKHFYDGNLSL